MTSFKLSDVQSNATHQWSSTSLTLPKIWLSGVALFPFHWSFLPTPDLLSMTLKTHRQTTFSGPAASAESPQVERESTPQNIHNAVLAPLHTSTTESILQWPHFDGFPELRQIYVSIFHLEQSRPSIIERSAAAMPWFNETDLDSIIETFENSINFWYPTMSRAKILLARERILKGDFDSSTSSCLAVLTLCLGCAAQYIPADGGSWDADIDFRQSRVASSEMYMDNVFRKLHVAHMEMSTIATQCLFFTA
jgi:hypothetical protein